MKTLNIVEISNISGGSWTNDHKTGLAIGGVVLVVISVVALISICPLVGVGAATTSTSAAMARWNQKEAGRIKESLRAIQYY